MTYTVVLERTSTVVYSVEVVVKDVISSAVAHQYALDLEMNNKLNWEPIDIENDSPTIVEVIEHETDSTTAS